MTYLRKIAVLLVLLALLVPLCPQAAAAESGAVWFETAASDSGLTVSVWTDAPVASGVLTFTFDRKVLTFVQEQVDESYVLAHAVNAQTVGTVRISWIAPEGMDAQGAHMLLQLHFTGTDDASLLIQGSAATVTGESVLVAMRDFAGLEALIAEAEGKDTQGYTPESVAALNTALENAKKVLQQEHVSPVALEAAKNSLQQALTGLQEPQPSQTDPGVQVQPDQNGNGLWIGLAVAGVCLAAVAAVMIIRKRRNG